MRTFLFANELLVHDFFEPNHFGDGADLLG
jgi:hypothetical protein